MKRPPDQAGKVVPLAGGLPALEIHIILGHDGSFAIAIEPDNAPLPDVVGVLEMAKFSAMGSRMNPLDEDTARELGADTIRHLDRKTRLAKRKTKGDPE